jgi:high-affinity iron transporter
MFLASFLIGLREGLEAALIVGILVAFVNRRGRRDVLPKIWWGVGVAALIAVALGALLTFGSYGLSFEGQEILGGTMSLLAVAMVTWMVFWMLKAGRRMKGALEAQAGDALALGTGWAIAWIAFLSVGREGVETTLMLWGWTLQPEALFGALTGIFAAATLGYALYRGMLHINLGSFFTYTGAFLIIVAAGILAYAIHDLQEAAVLPGPFSGHPITPTDLRTGEVLVGLTDGPFWMAAYPFGWAFDLTSVIDSTGVWATLAKGTLGLTPQMSWLEVTAWALYLLIVGAKFTASARRAKTATPADPAPLNATDTPFPSNTASPPSSSTPDPKGVDSHLIPERTAS